MLDLACDIAADKADTALNVWEAVERDVVGHSTVRWMAQVSHLLHFFWLSVDVAQLPCREAVSETSWGNGQRFAMSCVRLPRQPQSEIEC